MLCVMVCISTISGKKHEQYRDYIVLQQFMMHGVVPVVSDGKPSYKKNIEQHYM